MVVKESSNIKIDKKKPSEVLICKRFHKTCVITDAKPSRRKQIITVQSPRDFRIFALELQSLELNKLSSVVFYTF